MAAILSRSKCVDIYAVNTQFPKQGYFVGNVPNTSI